MYVEILLTYLIFLIFYYNGFGHAHFYPILYKIFIFFILSRVLLKIDLVNIFNVGFEKCLFFKINLALCESIIFRNKCAQQGASRRMFRFVYARKTRRFFTLENNRDYRLFSARSAFILSPRHAPLILARGLSMALPRRGKAHD